MVADYKYDIADMQVRNKGLTNSVDFQKKKNQVGKRIKYIVFF